MKLLGVCKWVLLRDMSTNTNPFLKKLQEKSKSGSTEVQAEFNRLQNTGVPNQPYHRIVSSQARC